MANFAGTCTSDNKGLLLLLLVTFRIYFTLLFSHLADAFIQSDLQLRKITKTIS